MKNLNYLILSFIFFAFLSLSSCGGYKPIFSAENLDFEISNHSISGDKILGNQLFARIKKSSKISKNSLEFFINISKNKEATSKSETGKVLEYKISLNTYFKVVDATTKQELINNQLTYSTTYKVEDQHYDTIKSENKSLENLINKVYQELLIKLSETIK